MSILFGCDYCPLESNDSGDIKEVNIIQVGAALNGKSQPNNELLKKGENQLCNSCYKTFIAWSGNELEVWIRTNFPLKKESDDNG